MFSLLQKRTDYQFLLKLNLLAFSTLQKIKRPGKIETEEEREKYKLKRGECVTGQTNTNNWGKKVPMTFKKVHYGIRHLSHSFSLSNIRKAYIQWGGVVLVATLHFP